MDRESYTILAKYYDAFQSDGELNETLDLILRCSALHLKGAQSKAPLRLADLGAGTGSLAVLLADAGFQVSAVDLSSAMLEALEKKRQRLAAASRQRLQSVRGDFVTYRFAEKQDILIALTDSLNHVPAEALSVFFERAAQNVKCGGLFIFDLLTRSFLATERGAATFFVELGSDPARPDVSMIWENHWDQEAATATADFTFFEREDGAQEYRRSTERIVEYYHDLETIEYLWQGAFERVDTIDSAERRIFVLSRL